MKAIWASILLATATSATAQEATTPTAPTPPRVSVSGGIVEGRIDPDRTVFRGIPFAAPPLGANRWREPQPVVEWTGIRTTTARAPACLQNDYGWNRADHVFASEDCLTLDVATPALTGKRPVIVWIHGGSNRAGSAGDMALSSIGKRGVVVVAVQYRLGIFGFLPHRALAAEADGKSGNYGLMDQIAALRWVRDNIAKFGGDPDNVTIAGESAGSQDVSLLLASPLARGLFAKAAMESGTPGFGLPWRPLKEAFRIGDQLDVLLGTRGSAPLRTASPAALLAADLKLHDAKLTADDYLYLRTTIDGAVLPDTPDRLFVTAPKRPVILGSNVLELDLPGGRPARDGFVDLSFGANADGARTYYRLDDADPLPQPRLGTRDQQIATDATFRCPAGALANLLANRNWPVWRYEFDMARGGGAGQTTHAAEIDYIFNDRRVGPVSMQDYWVAFATTGDPNGDGRPAWARSAKGKPANILFDARGATPRDGDIRPEICKLQGAL
ncbi:carboxylesterase/lipase family protein [Sphingomonas hankookensis]|uniref:carboxylesterase/lipase family protein n=1 Tax=Sphingomonas hankookensis TaxID=563996 RepID=UPI001F59FC9C|nr:carboxylesterase family protein [Sphingomonas hankookensis]